MRSNAAEKFQGNPCKFGHPGLRYQSSGACVECMRLHGIAKRQQRKAAAAAAASPAAAT